MPALQPKTIPSTTITDVLKVRIDGSSKIELSDGTIISLSDLVSKIEYLENIIEQKKSEDLYPTHIKKVCEKISELKEIIKTEKQLNNSDTQFIHPTLILVEQIENNIKRDNKITKQQIEELNKIYKKL